MSRPSPGSLWTGLRDGFRTQLWPLPTLAVALSIILGVALPVLEAAQTELVPSWLREYLFTGGADAARTVLDAVAGSLITVTALTFSLTVVSLQLASSQFSPRLLRTFTRDLVVQGTLGLFLGTFAYALTVLRTVRTSSDSRAEFVPDISVTLAYALTVVSIVGLIVFLAHLAQTIRVESMLHSVHQDASADLARLLAEGGAPPPALASLLPHGVPTVVTAAESGFLVRIQERDLLESAVREDVVVVLDVSPGCWVVAGTPVGGLWPAGGGGADERPMDQTRTAVGQALVTGFERTSVQDVAFGLRQLTDVAVKALSPGINDPTTAIHALGHSSALLAELVQRDLGPKVLQDEEGHTRVVLARPDFAALLHVALDQPAQYGATDPAVMAKLFVMLRELAWVCPTHHRPAVEREVTRLRRLVDRQDLDPADVAFLESCAGRVDDALSGRWDVGCGP